MLLPNCGPFPQISHTCAMTSLQTLVVFVSPDFNLLRAPIVLRSAWPALHGCHRAHEDARHPQLAESSVYLESPSEPNRTTGVHRAGEPASKVARNMLFVTQGHHRLNLHRRPRRNKS